MYLYFFRSDSQIGRTQFVFWGVRCKQHVYLQQKIFIKQSLKNQILCAYEVGTYLVAQKPDLPFVLLCQKIKTFFAMKYQIATYVDIIYHHILKCLLFCIFDAKNQYFGFKILNCTLFHKQGRQTSKYQRHWLIFWSRRIKNLYSSRLIISYVQSLNCYQ